MNKLLVSTLIIFTLTTSLSFSGINNSHLYVVDEIQDEAMKYEMYAHSQLSKVEYKEFMKKLNITIKKLDSIEKDLLDKNSTKLYSHEDFVNISYGMYNLCVKYGIDFSKLYE